MLKLLVTPYVNVIMVNQFTVSVFSGLKNILITHRDFFWDGGLERMMEEVESLSSHRIGGTKSFDAPDSMALQCFRMIARHLTR